MKLKALTFLKTFSILFLVFIVISQLGLRKVNAASTYYVSTTGNDTSSGVSSAPFRTIQKAVDVMSAGDVIIVKDGTYDSIEIKRAGTSVNPIIIEAENIEKAKIVAPQDWAYHGIYFYGSASYITLKGFDISGGQDAIFFEQGSHNIDITQNNIHDTGRFCTNITLGLTGIYMNSASNITIENNTFHDIGRFLQGENGCQYTTNALDHGIYINGSDHIYIKNNIFYKFAHGWGIQVYSSTHQTTDNVNIWNNTFDFKIPTKSGQIILSGNFNNGSIINNIFYQPQNWAIDYFEPVLSNITISNNMIKGGITQNTSVSGVTTSNNLENKDPLFINVVQNNYHLQSTSPAINAGQTLAEVTRDFDSKTRPQGGGYDIGAYEYITTSTKPPACKADYNFTGTVDIADFATFAQNYKKTGINCAFDLIGGNCLLDINDFQIFASIYKISNACI